MDEAIDRIYRVVRFFLDVVVANAAAFVLLAATLLAITEIFRRYIFGLVFEWGQDLVTYMLMSAVFLFFAVTQARRGHLVMSAALDAFSARGWGRLIQICRTIVTTVSLGLYGYFAYWSIPAIERNILLGRKTQSMVFEIWPFQLCLSIGFALMAVVTLFHLYQDLRGLAGKTVFPWAPAETHTDI
ncbi:MAG: TRAP transporter small permease [Proteobacteria bacterium]|nr:TRAP transporter small permease [Pseudomonadota bacterium]MDA1310397.1 TRAP transporter small permease [Pseudomonadota bacterium]